MGKKISSCSLVAKETNNYPRKLSILNNHPQIKDKNVVGVVCDINEQPKWCTKEAHGVTNKLKPDSIFHSIMQIRT